jgi:hypothetical protein
MHVVPADESGSRATHHGLWWRLAEALDRYVADRSKLAVPPATLRRSRHDIVRCRRLMRGSVAVPSAATLRAAGVLPR